MSVRLLALIGLLTLATVCEAHDEVQKRIDALTKSLEKTEHKRDQAKLLWQRAQQHQIHRDWALAFCDYQRAQQISPSITTQNVEPELTPESKDALERAAKSYRKRVERKPQDYRSRRSLAEVRTHLGRTKLAAEDYALILERGSITRTDDVLAWAVATTAIDRKERPDAQKKLEDHLARLLKGGSPSSEESWRIVQVFELLAEFQAAAGEEASAKKSLQEAQRQLLRFKPTDPESEANKLRVGARIHRRLHPTETKPDPQSPTQGTVSPVGDS